LENTFGLIIEDSVNRDLVSWFKSEGIELPSLRARTLKVGNRVLEFDFYAEVGNKVFVGGDQDYLEGERCDQVRP